MSMNGSANYLENWKPGEDFGIIFEDKTCVAESDPKQFAYRSAEQITEMFNEMRAIAIKNGFDLSMWGTRPQFHKSLCKEYGRQRWEAAVKARDTQIGHDLYLSSYPEFQP